MDAFSEFCMTMAVVSKAYYQGTRQDTPYNFWNGVMQGESNADFVWEHVIREAMKSVKKSHKKSFKIHKKLRNGQEVEEYGRDSNSRISVGQILRRWWRRW